MNKQLFLKRLGTILGILGGVNLIMTGQSDVGGAVIAASLGSATFSK